MRADDILLLDMLIAARDARDFIRGDTFGDFSHDRMKQLAVFKCMEIIGEAAGKISKEFRETLPDIPWREIISMRNRLVHGYFEIHLANVWETVVEDIPVLIRLLEKHVQPEEDM